MAEWLRSQCTPTSGGCLEWGRTKHNFGYGMLSYHDRMWTAHRLMWTLTHGPVPEELCVLHRCDNPPCCNPDHLFLGTHADNVRDKIEKGRMRHGHLYGEESPQSKFSDATVKSIFRMWRDGMTQTSIARKLGCSQSMISAILLRKKRAWASEGETYSPRMGRPSGSRPISPSARG